MGHGTPYIPSVVVGLLIAGGAHAQTVCSPMSQEELKRVETFLLDRDSRILGVRAEPISVATGACYRTIVVSREGGGEDRLLLSPDHRFLSVQVIDTRPELAKREQIKRDAIRTMLEGALDRPHKGAANAHVKIDVFSDFQCPYCRQEFQMLNNTYFPEHSGEVRITFHQNPLPNHSWARRAAEITECANNQESTLFWAAHDFLFENQNSITSNNIERRVSEVLSTYTAFRPDEFQSCLSGPASKPWPGIENDRRLAVSLDVRRTPTMFINGLKIAGTPPVEQLDTLVVEMGGRVAISPGSSLARKSDSTK